jgi:hypothetical protein
MNTQVSDLGIHVSLVCESLLFTGEESRDQHSVRAGNKYSPDSAASDVAWLRKQVATYTQVRAALDELNPELRAVIVLQDIEGLSCEEIAATLGIKSALLPLGLVEGDQSCMRSLPVRQKRQPKPVISIEQ